MRLFVAEKPELGRAIADALGVEKKEGGAIRCQGGDVVTWCFGHLLTLTDPEDHNPDAKRWNMESLPLSWPVAHKPIDDKKDQVELIRNLAGQAREIVHAGDPDDEGQLLVDEVLTYIGNRKPVRRILINDLNQKIIQRALNNLRDNSEFYGLSQSALARSVSDQVYGYNLTRAYTLAGRAAGATQVLSVGRVQTPILGLVVRRDRAHKDHNAHNYYDLTGVFSGTEGRFTAKHVPSKNAPVDDKGRVIQESYVTAVLDAVIGQSATIIQAASSDKEESQPLPYNLLNLQADASRKFGFSPDKTLKVTQSLRERRHLITYNRSDCEYLSDEQHDDAPAVLAAIAQTAPILSKAATAGDPTIKSRAFNSHNVSAHHAIIPTETTANLNNLTDDEAKLYLLISRAYIAQFFPKYAYRETAVVLDVAGYGFKATSRVKLRDGWKRLYSGDKDNEDIHQDDDTGSDNLEWINKESNLVCENATSEKKKTNPPPLYTMSSLLKDLARVSKYVTDPRIKKLLLSKDQEKKGEHGGIGTPATRSAIIAQLMKRNYIAEKGKKVVSTDVGQEFYDLLPATATAPDMTALWHEQQEQIKAGEMTMEQFVQGVRDYVNEEVARIKNTGIKVKAASGPACPECGNGTLIRRKGENGYFWGCSAYPDCKASRPDVAGKPGKKKVRETANVPCPKCGKDLVRRKKAGKKGYDFWSCSGFPTCKTKYDNVNGKPKIA